MAAWDLVTAPLVQEDQREKREEEVVPLNSTSGAWAEGRLEKPSGIAAL